MQRLLFTLIVILAVATFTAYFTLLPSEQTPSTSAPTLSEQDNSEAKRHISQLTQSSQQPIDIQQADNFVTADQLLQLPAPKQNNQALLEEVAPDQPAPLNLAEDTAAAGDSQDQSNTFAVSSHLSVISSSNRTLSGNAANIQKGNELIAGAPVVAINGNQIKLQELLDEPDQAKEKIYFIHAVNDSDRKGLWGIIQAGLTQTFTQGLNLPGLAETVYVEIPAEADEKLQDKRSSFLGRILKNKVDKTYIYNYQQGILGDNPDLIQPGQQLVIVTFTEQELIGIYHHFVNL